MSERFITQKEVTERTTLSKPRIYALIKEGAFPDRIPLGKFKVVWLESEVEAWMKAQATKALGGEDERRRRLRSQAGNEARRAVR